MKLYANKKRTRHEFNLGNWVYLCLQNYWQTSLSLYQDFKLTLRFYGPYHIMACIGKVAYDIAQPELVSIHTVFHVSIHKKHIGETISSLPTLPPITIDDLLVIESLKILDQ